MRIQPQVTIDGQVAEVVFSGLTPGRVGLYQIRMVVPERMSAGEVEVVVTQGGAKANVAELVVGR